MEIKEISLKRENLIKIKAIDDEFLKDEKLSIKFYLERYNEFHKAFVLKNKEHFVGYIVCVPIKEELYETLKSGVLVNDICINPDMFVNKSKYNYIVSVCILEKYRSKGYGEQLFLRLLETSLIGNYVALAITTEGYSLARKYMNMIKKIDKKTAIFEYIKT